MTPSRPHARPARPPGPPEYDGRHGRGRMLLQHGLPRDAQRLLVPRAPAPRVPGHERQRLHEHDDGRVECQHGILT